jgi:hypothetical protein
MSNEIPPNIVAWIEKDTLYLQNTNLKRFEAYKKWFYDPSTPIEPNWYVAIDQVIKELEGTKQ